MPLRMRGAQLFKPVVVVISADIAALKVSGNTTRKAPRLVNYLNPVTCSLLVRVAWCLFMQPPLLLESMHQIRYQRKTPRRAMHRISIRRSNLYAFGCRGFTKFPGLICLTHYWHRGTDNVSSFYRKRMRRIRNDSYLGILPFWNCHKKSGSTHPNRTPPLAVPPLSASRGRQSRNLDYASVRRSHNWL